MSSTRPRPANYRHATVRYLGQAGPCRRFRRPSLLALALRGISLGCLLVATVCTSIAFADGERGLPSSAGGDFAGLVGQLGLSDSDLVAKAIEELGKLGDPKALPVLEALCDGRLRFDAQGRACFRDDTGKLHDALTGSLRPPATDLREPAVDNEVRRAAAPIIAGLRLGSNDRDVRLQAAQELAKNPDPALAPALRAALAREKDRKIIDALSLATAELDLKGQDEPRRVAAAATLGKLGNGAVVPELESLLAVGDDGRPRERQELRAAAQRALGAIRARERLIGLAGDLLYGVSLASVLLFVAIGLAITFGLMGVINMAHGEMLMIGAYATYAVQGFFQQHAPGLVQHYLLAAIPTAFIVCMLVGMALERSVIRFLYGRPLETLLATWGISLMLIQLVRLRFGAQNVAVESPSWLQGGTEILDGIVLPYNRLGVIVFVVVVVAFVWFVLQRTRLGLQVRAVTQNRAMASAMGIRTSRVDMWTFGLGSGLAGLGGVALSQLGNVGPELGQSYIIDAFMVVVLGGVGKISGAIAASLGLGLVNKLLEPFAGAVLGKIAVLVFIILFIQKRPQGIFALRGRASEV